MPFFGNRRRDFSIQPPRQQVDGTPFYVTDSANIDFTLDNLNLTADLTFTGVTAGTYGDATNIPVLQIDQWGRVTGVTLQPISPSGLALEVNGTANGDQTLLNLVAGTNMTITDDGLGNITFDATGGGGTYTVNNGLTENPTGNFQLGSTTSGGAPLLHDTYIDTVVNHTLYLQGQKTSTNDFILDVDNSTADGGAIRASAVGGGNAIRALSSLASALAANSTGAPAIAATTGGANEAGLFVNSDTGTNNIVQGIKLRHSSSGVPAPGFGIAADFTGKTTLNSDLRLGRLIYQWTDPITISRTSKFQLETVNLNAAGIKLEVDGPGQLKLNRYGQTPANFPGTAVWTLGVDALGNVVEFTPSTGTGTVTSVSATVPSPTSPALSVNVTNPTTTPAIAITANGTTSEYVRGDGSLATFPTIPSGTVTSVGATVPAPTNPALSVNVTNPTTTPAIAITANGTTSQYVRGDGSLQTFPSVVAPATVFFGDGFDGAIILNGSNTYSSIMSLAGSTYTLLRSIYPSSITVNNGITLLTNGYQVTCNGTMTVDGTVGSIGNNGGNAVTVFNNYSTVGAGGASLKPNGTVTDQILVGPSTGGGNGNNGSTGWGSAGGSISVTWYYYGALGGGGGRGWVNLTTQGPASTVTVSGVGKFLPYPTFNTGLSNHIGWLTVNAVNFGGVLVGSGGGGGGGAGTQLGGGWGGAGGGGGGGPLGVKILANALTVSATGIIRSNGGNGGNGCPGSLSNWAHGAGGGGGNGGIVYIVTNTLTYTPNNQIQAKGGIGGLGGVGVGTASGLVSTPGSNGADGYVHIMNTSTGLSTFYTGQY
jgi:hypothetical protein